MITAAGFSMLLNMALKVPIRGAVEIGFGWELKRGELFGPALSRANYLEKNVAQWPRVVLGPNLVSFLRSCMESTGTTIEAKSNKGTATLCQGLVQRDVDGIPFVHYLGPGFRRNESDVKTLGPSISDGLQFVRQQHQRFAEKPDQKLAMRYAQVRSYYEVNAPEWTT